MYFKRSFSRDGKETKPLATKPSRSRRDHPLLTEICTYVYNEHDKTIPGSVHAKANDDDSLIFLGVSASQLHNLKVFNVRIRCAGYEEDIGVFLNKIQAAIAYDVEARERGMYNNLNFPLPSDKCIGRRATGSKALVRDA